MPRGREQSAVDLGRAQLAAPGEIGLRRGVRGQAEDRGAPAAHREADLRVELGHPRRDRAVGLGEHQLQSRRGRRRRGARRGHGGPPGAVPSSAAARASVDIGDLPDTCGVVQPGQLRELGPLDGQMGGEQPRVEPRPHDLVRFEGVQGLFEGGGEGGDRRRAPRRRCPPATPWARRSRGPALPARRGAGRPGRARDWRWRRPRGTPG